MGKSAITRIPMVRSEHGAADRDGRPCPGAALEPPGIFYFEARRAFLQLSRITTVQKQIRSRLGAQVPCFPWRTGVAPHPGQFDGSHIRGAQGDDSQIGWFHKSGCLGCALPFVTAVNHFVSCYSLLRIGYAGFASGSRCTVYRLQKNCPS